MVVPAPQPDPAEARRLGERRASSGRRRGSGWHGTAAGGVGPGSSPPAAHPHRRPAGGRRRDGRGRTGTWLAGRPRRGGRDGVRRLGPCRRRGDGGRAGRRRCREPGARATGGDRTGRRYPTTVPAPSGMPARAGPSVRPATCGGTGSRSNRAWAGASTTSPPRSRRSSAIRVAGSAGQRRPVPTGRQDGAGAVHDLPGHPGYLGTHVRGGRAAHPSGYGSCRAAGPGHPERRPVADGGAGLRRAAGGLPGLRDEPRGRARARRGATRPARVRGRRRR